MFDALWWQSGTVGKGRSWVWLDMSRQQLLKLGLQITQEYNVSPES